MTEGKRTKVAGDRVIIDDPYDPATWDTPECRAKVRKWFDEMRAQGRVKMEGRVTTIMAREKP